MSFVDYGDPRYADSFRAALAEGLAMPGDRAPEPDARLVLPAEAHLPDGSTIRRPPTLALWWIEADAYIGSLYIHRDLADPFVAEYVGHILYAVRPSRQGNGHAGRMLAAARALAGAAGIDPVRVYARATNIASCRVIERAGGALLDLKPLPYDPDGPPLRRYAIPTG